MEVGACTAGLRRKEDWGPGPMELGVRVSQFLTVEGSGVWTLASE